MGWVEEQFERRVQSGYRREESPVETRFELLVDRKWAELIQGLQGDAEEYRRLGGDVAFAQVSEQQWRIANRSAGIAAVLSVDLSAHTIKYTYEPENANTAVPEGGVFSMRRSGPNTVELYSSDQQTDAEQARRMVLEPLLFPNPPHVQ
jgi:hypothetical protein